MSAEFFDGEQQQDIKLAPPDIRAEYFVHKTAEHLDDVKVFKAVAFCAGVTAVASFGVETIENSPTLFTRLGLVSGIFIGTIALAQNAFETYKYKREARRFR